jgi:hypothetical protein
MSKQFNTFLMWVTSILLLGIITTVILVIFSDDSFFNHLGIGFSISIITHGLIKIFSPLYSKKIAFVLNPILFFAGLFLVCGLLGWKAIQDNQAAETYTNFFFLYAPIGIGWVIFLSNFSYKK